MTTLTPFDDHDVVETTVRIVGVGDGLSEALEVEPVELHHGQIVHIVLRGEVTKITYEPTKAGDELRRVHTVRASFGTIVDQTVVRKVLDAQRKAIDKAKGVNRLPGIDGDGELPERLRRVADEIVIGHPADPQAREDLMAAIDRVGAGDD
jgi:hypothetical protein